MIKTAAAILPFLVVLLAYNRFVSQRQLIRESWSGIDVELHRRHELVSNLVETVRSLADFEASVLESVVTARDSAVKIESAPPRDRQGVESDLGLAATRFVAVAEAHPVLSSAESFLQLQKELVETENRLARARRFYNANVRAYNTRLSSIPTNVVARLCKFEPADFFQSDLTASPVVDL